MMWGYVRGADGRPPSPLSLPVKSHCHWLITGASGSGKSQTILYLLGCLLQEIPETDIFFCDFKNSEDFAFLKEYPHYYSGNDCYAGIMEYYKNFCHARETGQTTRRHMLFVDEYPAFISYLSMKDKQEKTKASVDILGSIAEILMLGRGIGYHLGHGYGVCLCTQRADATLFANGSRDNFMIICGLGRMSKEQKSMLFSGEEIPERIYRPGEGILLADGQPIHEVCFPRIRNTVDWKKHILLELMKHYHR